ncbi:proteasome activator subunit 4 [Tanacetum coccineum]
MENIPTHSSTKGSISLLSSADDPNWRTRSATLTILRSFMYRHTFILSNDEKQKIWKTVEKLLTDNQVEASLILFLLFVSVN